MAGLETVGRGLQETDAGQRKLLWICMNPRSLAALFLLSLNFELL